MGISRLLIHVYYTNMAPFKSPAPGMPLRTMIWSHTWGGGPGGIVTDRNKLLRDLPDCHTNLTHLFWEGEWAYVSKSSSHDPMLRWIDAKHGCVTPIIPNEEVVDCVKKDLDSLTIMGDSHIRMYSKW